MVRSIRLETTAAGRRTNAVGENSGSVGNSSAAVPASVKRDRPQWISRYEFAVAASRTGSSGSSRTISKSLRAETVRLPAFDTSAGCEPRMPTSRSVAAISRWPGSPLVARSKALARIGIELRFSTIAWMRVRPRWSSDRGIESFIFLPTPLSKWSPGVVEVEPDEMRRNALKCVLRLRLLRPRPRRIASGKNAADAPPGAILPRDRPDRRSRCARTMAKRPVLDSFEAL